MQKLNNLALRRNLFFPSAEIYPNAPAGFYDFGPIGTSIRNNVINFWRKHLVNELDALEIDGSIILPESVFEASGHIDSFFDPVVKEKKTGIFYRADKLLGEIGIEIGEKTSTDEIDRLILENEDKLKKQFEKSFRFNLMYNVDIGVGKGRVSYLKPEACQNIFLNFKRVYTNSRRNLPLPIAQISKAFRNEIAPRNGLIRVREFYQSDIEVFFNPKSNKWDVSKYDSFKIPLKTTNSKSEYELKSIKEWKELDILKYDFEIYYLVKLYEFYEKLGYNMEKVRFLQVSLEDRPFYSLSTWDFEAEVEDVGWVEIIAINYRTDYDLKRHEQFSKTKLSINENGEEFTPHIFELSMGLDRTFYCLLSHRLEEKDERIVLKLKREISPNDIAIYPLVNKDGINEIANDIYMNLKSKINVLYDEKGSIGKRYARSDEIGIRYAITVDYETKEDNKVTIRDSWSGEQKRIDISKILENLV